jgi:biotin carboxyl carrier protein
MTAEAAAEASRALSEEPLDERTAQATLTIVQVGTEVIVSAEDEQQTEAGASPSGESVGLPMRLVVSPIAGRLRLLPPAQFHAGSEWVTRGQALAEVSNGPAVHQVLAPHDARVAGIMVGDGEPVAQGQPLVWLDETSRRPRDEPPPRDDPQSRAQAPPA